MAIRNPRAERIISSVDFAGRLPSWAPSRTHQARAVPVTGRREGECLHSARTESFELAEVRSEPTRRSRSELILRTNHRLVLRYFPQFRLHQTADPPYYQGWYNALSGRRFQFRLALPPGSPDVKPRLYVWRPTRLPKFGGGTLNDAGSLHEFHTMKNGPAGRVQICHVPNWNAAVTYVAVLGRALLWAEAYCAHLREGRPISDYFR